MKGLFIPEITAEMFRNGCLESIESLIAEGEIYDIDYPLEQEPCKDAISREDAIMCMTGEYVADMTYKPEDIISKHIQRLRALPPVAPQEPISQG